MSTNNFIPAIGADAEPNDYDGLKTLMGNLVYRLTGCGELMIRKTLQAVYREFCEQTGALRVSVGQALVSGQNEYRITVPYSGLVDAVVTVSIGERTLAKSEFTLRDGQPLTIGLQDGVAESELRSDPTAKLSELVVVIPSMGSEECPYWFYQMYGAALVSGVLYRLMSMLNKPWSDAQQAVIERTDYVNAISKAVIARYASSAASDKSLSCAPKRILT